MLKNMPMVKTCHEILYSKSGTYLPTEKCKQNILVIDIASFPPIMIKSALHEQSMNRGNILTFYSLKMFWWFSDT